MKVVCNVTRGEDIESYHTVHAVAIDEGGDTIFLSGPNFFGQAIDN